LVEDTPEAAAALLARIRHPDVPEGDKPNSEPTPLWFGVVMSVFTGGSIGIQALPGAVEAHWFLVFLAVVLVVAQLVALRSMIATGATSAREEIKPFAESWPMWAAMGAIALFALGFAFATLLRGSLWCAPVGIVVGAGFLALFVADWKRRRPEPEDADADATEDKDAEAAATEDKDADGPATRDKGTDAAATEDTDADPADAA
jgi:hypothetical protein